MAKIQASTKECYNLTEEELEKVVKYFTVPSQTPTYLIIVGAILALIGFGAVLFLLIGIILIALGIKMLHDRKQNKVSDEEFDEIQYKAKRALDCVALSKLGLDKSDTTRDNLKIIGPRYFSRGGAELVFKRGEDGIVRYSLVNVVILNFTKKHLALYRCALDLQTGNRLNEETEEFFYKDVVSVKTYTDTNKLLDKEGAGQFSVVSGESGSTVTIDQKMEWETFALLNSGGDKIEVPVQANTLLKHMGGRFEESEIDKVVNSIRVILRDKK